MRRRAAILSALVLALAACDSSTEPEIPRVNGTWTGSFPVTASASATLAITMSEDASGAISGSATISGAGQSFALQVKSGTHAHPDVGVTLGAAGYEDIAFTGRFFGEAEIRGALDGSGFSDTQVTLTRASG